MRRRNATSEATTASSIRHRSGSPSHSHSPTMSTELDGLCCPLTLEVFEDPCTLVGDGHTYERSSIQAWLDSGKLTSPPRRRYLAARDWYQWRERTIAEPAPRALPPKGTSPRLATEVSQLAAAPRSSRSQRNRRRRPPERPAHRGPVLKKTHGFSEAATLRSKRGFSEGNRASPIATNQAGRREARHGQGRRPSKDTAAASSREATRPTRASPSPSVWDDLVGWGKKKERKAGLRGRR